MMHRYMYEIKLNALLLSIQCVQLNIYLAFPLFLNLSAFSSNILHIISKVTKRGSNTKKGPKKSYSKSKKFIFSHNFPSKKQIDLLFARNLLIIIINYPAKFNLTRSRTFGGNRGKNYRHTHRHINVDENNICSKTKFLGQLIKSGTNIHYDL